MEAFLRWLMEGLLVTNASPTDREEHRRARDGKWYTVEEFQQHYKEDWWYYWDEAGFKT